MKVISLVPSWTESLLEAGIDVVGRSRYCIHPFSKVKALTVVGGTKDVDWEIVKKLNADVLLLDREENTKEMADASPIKIIDTHVDSIEALAREFKKLGSLFSNSKLQNFGDETLEILKQQKLKWDWETPPGAIEWIKKTPNKKYKKFVYLIWKNPWMSVSKTTFIGSMLDQLGGGDFHLVPGNLENGKYPKFDLESLNPEEDLLLFSSEPYPFAKRKQEISSLEFDSVLVDGEVFSWFGVRTLSFLKMRLAKS